MLCYILMSYVVKKNELRNKFYEANKDDTRNTNSF